MDAVTIDVELETVAPRDEPFIAKLQADIRAHLKTMMGLSCDISLKQPGEVPRSQGKAVRVKDLRKQ
jgi:phenylacetate-CoA ligase